MGTSRDTCGPESGAKKLKVKVATAVKVKVGVNKLKATATASDFAVATFKIIQNGKTYSRKVYLIKPKKKLKVALKTLSNSKLAKGKARVTARAIVCNSIDVCQLKTSRKKVTLR